VSDGKQHPTAVGGQGFHRAPSPSCAKNAFATICVGVWTKSYSKL